MDFTNALLATVLVLVLYLLAGFSVRDRWQHRLPLNPLKIVAGVSGRASLSNAQVFFFTLIVAWLAIYWLLQEAKLVPINNTVLALLGITVVGSGASKAAAISRFRITGPNWAWAKKKQWIQKDFSSAPLEHTPRLADLITSDQGFEIAKFQAVVFSAVIGLSLLYYGATIEDAAAFSGFTIDDAYLTLIGISQGVYVGGKVIGSNLFAELNQKLDKVRELELAFVSAVGGSAEWASATTKDLTLAREKCAPKEYAAYMSTATEAAEIVSHMISEKVDAAKVEPTLPT